MKSYLRRRNRCVLSLLRTNLLFSESFTKMFVVVLLSLVVVASTLSCPTNVRNRRHSDMKRERDGELFRSLVSRKRRVVKRRPVFGLVVLLKMDFVVKMEFIVVPKETFVSIMEIVHRQAINKQFVLLNNLSFFTFFFDFRLEFR